MKKNFTFPSFDEKEIPATSYKALGAKAVVQIVHGMAEHQKRYEDFALYLNKNDFNVYTHDLRGHGENIENGDSAGYLGEDGWNACLQDTLLLSRRIKKENPRLPLFLLGHSMGSFLARQYLLEFPDAADGFIFSGTAASMGVTGKFMIWKAKQEMKKNGAKNPSLFLSGTMTKTLNRKFHEEGANGFEWISSDALQVKKYTDDPLCGFPSTPNLFLYMAQANLLVNRPETFEAYPKDMPILFVSGSEDTVGGKKAVKKVVKKMQKAGLQDVTRVLYQGARHEVLNELNNQEVYYDIAEWLKKHTSKP